jgi:hypothetical protein
LCDRTEEIMSEEKREFRNRDRLLLVSLWLGPVAALSNLTINYSLVAEACLQGTKTMLHAITAAFVVIALASGLVAYRYYRQFAEAEGVLWMERTRWFALLALVLSLASAVVMVAMEVPNVLLRSCT